jgi:hypothetical protein
MTSSNGLGNYIGQKQVDIERSGFSPINNDFEPQLYDEIRFEGLENLSFQIVNITSSVGQLKLNLNRNIPNGTNLDYFLLRRYIIDPSNIILDKNKPVGSSSGGILKPQFVSPGLKDNIDTVIQNLRDKNLI